MVTTPVSITEMAVMRGMVSDFSAFNDEYIFARLTAGQNPIDVYHERVRCRGVVMMLCLDGSLNLEVNQEIVTMEAPSVIMLRNEALFAINDFDRERLDCYMLAISTDFMQNLHIDHKVMMSVPVEALRQTGAMELTHEHADRLRQYFELLSLNADDMARGSDPLYGHSISRCLVCAIVYYMVALKAQAGAKLQEDSQLRRPNNYVHDFMRMVHQNYRNERSVGYYARQLCITPKYLSSLVKQATGRRAVDWINDIVILEAKNLLKFSGRNVQQVAYDLGFPNQSSFGKYFKSLTGLSPTDFQRS